MAPFYAVFTLRTRLIVAGAVLGVLLNGCGGSSSTTSTRGTAVTAASASSRPSASATQPVTAPPHTAPAPPRPPRPVNPCHDGSAGSQPQTDVVPSTSTSCFHAKMAALWQGIRRGSPAAARPAFFPEGAYLQLKTIGDARGDYEGRLLGDYALDLSAAHALLGAGAAEARLVDVVVPSGYAHWIPPGVCDNAIGYYETPNSRLVYSEGGEIKSLGIASMISWRGIWYVVHLGAILRSAAEGVVDDPEVGRGVALASSTC